MPLDRSEPTLAMARVGSVKVPSNSLPAQRSGRLARGQRLWKAMWLPLGSQ